MLLDKGAMSVMILNPKHQISFQEIPLLFFDPATKI